MFNHLTCELSKLKGLGLGTKLIVSSHRCFLIQIRLYHTIKYNLQTSLRLKVFSADSGPLLRQGFCPAVGFFNHIRGNLEGLRPGNSVGPSNSSSFVHYTQPRPLKINSCVFLGIRPPQKPEDSWQGCIQWGWFCLITTCVEKGPWLGRTEKAGASPEVGQLA